MTRAPSLSWRTLNCFEFYENGVLELDDAMINLIMDSSVCGWVRSIVNDLGVPVSRKGLQLIYLALCDEVHSLSDAAAEIPDIFARLDSLDRLQNLMRANHELHGVLKTTDFSTKSKKWYLFVILSLLMIGGIEPNPGPPGGRGGGNRRRERQQEHDGRPETPATTGPRTAESSRRGGSGPDASRGDHRRGGRGRGPFVPGPIPGSSGNRAMHENMANEIQRLQGHVDAERELRREAEERKKPEQPPEKPVPPAEDPIGTFSVSVRTGFWFGDRVDYGFLKKLFKQQLKVVCGYGFSIQLVVFSLFFCLQYLISFLGDLISIRLLLVKIWESDMSRSHIYWTLLFSDLWWHTVQAWNGSYKLFLVNIIALAVVFISGSLAIIWKLARKRWKHGAGQREYYMKHNRTLGDPAERTAAGVYTQDLRSEGSRLKEIKYVPRLEVWTVSSFKDPKLDVISGDNDLVVSMTLAYFVYSSKAINCDDDAKLFERIQMAVHQYPMVHISAVCGQYPTHSIYSDTARFVYGLCMSQRDRDVSLDFLH